MTTLRNLILNCEPLADVDAVRRSENNAFALNTEGYLTALFHSGGDMETLVLDEQAQFLTYLCIQKNDKLTRIVFKTPLPQLKYLDISGNKALKHISMPEGCGQLEQLYLRGNALETLVFEGDCPVLTLLDVSENQFAAFHLPEGFDALAYLYLNGNKKLDKTDLPSLPALVTLSLANNGLTEVYREWLHLPKLKNLYLSGNPQIPETNSGAVENEYYGNKNALSHIKDYFADLAKGDTLDNEYKTLLIGNGSVGKTCLVHRLVDDKFKENWDSTHGISLRRKEDTLYNFNIWDFGGQDIYHATHRLFMKSNALYLVLWDTKTANDLFTECTEGGEKRRYDNYPLSYWLDYAKCQGENSPVIVVQTKAKPQTQTNLPDVQETYKPQFPFLDFKSIPK
jgi:hypothetical protein